MIKYYLKEVFKIIKGLYTAASAMLAQKQNMKVITNNLTNADTDGYKRQGVVQSTFSEMLITKITRGNSEPIGRLGTGVSLHDSYTDFSAGGYEFTDNKLDLALKGRGFFVVETPQGRRYTRNGNFTLNSKGEIVTQEGNFLLNTEGRHIQTLPDRELNIDGYGNLHFEDLTGGRIQVVDFTDYNILAKEGDNNYRLKEGINENDYLQNADNCQVVEGYLENSNVNIVEEMVKMIEATRAYETNQKMIQNMDSTLDKAVNQVARLG